MMHAVKWVNHFSHAAEQSQCGFGNSPPAISAKCAIAILNYLAIWNLESGKLDVTLDGQTASIGAKRSWLIRAGYKPIESGDIPDRVKFPLASHFRWVSSLWKLSPLS
jgi:hypothetical protein